MPLHKEVAAILDRISEHQKSILVSVYNSTLQTSTDMADLSFMASRGLLTYTESAQESDPFSKPTGYSLAVTELGACVRAAMMTEAEFREHLEKLTGKPATGLLPPEATLAAMTLWLEMRTDPVLRYQLQCLRDKREFHLSVARRIIGYQDSVSPPSQEQLRTLQEELGAGRITREEYQRLAKVHRGRHPVYEDPDPNPDGKCPVCGQIKSKSWTTNNSKYGCGLCGRLDCHGGCVR